MKDERGATSAGVGIAGYKPEWKYEKQVLNYLKLEDCEETIGTLGCVRSWDDIGNFHKLLFCRDVIDLGKKIKTSFLIYLYDSGLMDDCDSLRKDFFKVWREQYDEEDGFDNNDYYYFIGKLGAYYTLSNLNEYLYELSRKAA
jgi:hypothetical protein